uniref:ATP synthase F0 subunit 8 n=1 Tax=Tryonicus mackerrasae TaxID=2093453 RepID=A0A2P1H912_9NEOP|nr:ATP synthase F0 subunit 8 [Tryonicus mackerrasae]
MPQMMPMSWLMLFTFFLMMFMLFNTINYFMFMPQKKDTMTSTNITMNMTWKW